MESIFTIGLILIIALFVILAIYTVFSLFYKKVGANKVMVVTGAFLRGKEKIIRGGGTIVIPGLQEVQYLELSAFTLDIDIKSSSLTQVPLQVEGTATLNLGDTEELLITAARKFLGLSNEERNTQLRDVVEGQVRGILGEMRPEDAVNKKAEFADKISEDLAPLLDTFGVKVMSVQINDVTDGEGAEGYIQSLFSQDVAQKRASAERASAEAQAQARIAIAEQELIAKRQEEATARKIAEEKKITAIEIARNKEEQDGKQAIADKAYQISEAEVEKRVIETEGAARALKAETDADVARREVEIEKQRLQASIIAKTSADNEAKKIEAEADKQASMFAVEADFFRKQKQAEAEAYEVEKRATAQAEEITKRGQAEADAIKAKGLAEAESAQKLAEALKDQGDVVLVQALIEKLPEIARALAEPISNIDELKVFNGVDGLTDQTTGGLSATMDFLKGATGVDVPSIIQNRSEGRLTIAKPADVVEVLDEITDSEED